MDSEVAPTQTQAKDFVAYIREERLPRLSKSTAGANVGTHLTAAPALHMGAGDSHLRIFLPVWPFGGLT